MEMKIGEVLNSGFETLRRNKILILPPIIAMFFITVLDMFLNSGASLPHELADPNNTGEQTMDTVGEGFTTVDIIKTVVAFIVQTLTHGMVIAMVKDIVKTGSTSLTSGLNTTVQKMFSLLIAFLLIRTLVVVGLHFFVLPGFVFLYLFMFSSIIIIVDDAGPFMALQGSIAMVKNRFRETTKLFFSLLGIFLLVALTNTVLAKVLIIGQLVNVVLTGSFVAYISIVLVLSYNLLALQQKEM